MKQAKILLCLALIGVVAFFLRAYPHLFLVYRWIPEEEFNYITVQSLIHTGNPQGAVGWYPLLTHYSVYASYLITRINPVTLCQYFNPFVGALMVIPIYLLMRQFLNQKKSLIVTVFWAFSEVAIFRELTFGSTETLAMFLVVWCFYFYAKKKYVPAGAFLVLSFASHLLPGTFAIFTIFIHQLFYGSKRNKIVMIALVVACALFLYSPLDPQQRVLASLNPVYLFSLLKLSNLLLYSTSDLLTGVQVYLGTVVLVCLTIASLFISASKSKLMWSMLFANALLFAWSWIDYNETLGASPPRLMVFFVIPCAYFATFMLEWFASKINNHQYRAMGEKLMVGLVLFTMLFAFSSGLTPISWIGYSLTKGETIALDDIQAQHFIQLPYYYGEIWGDYPAEISFASRFGDIQTQSATADLANTITAVASKEQLFLNVSSSVTSFKYVFISPRIEKDGFFIVETTMRTIRVHEAVSDVWAGNSSSWKLIYKNSYGVKLYEYVSS